MNVLPLQYATILVTQFCLTLVVILMVAEANLIAAPIVHKTVVRADRNLTFTTLATADGLDRWMTRGTYLEERTGGALIFRWEDWGADRITAKAIGRVVTYQRSLRLVFDWQREIETRVSLEFADVQEGTLVKVSEIGYPDEPSGWENCLDRAIGWGETLTLAKIFLEHGITYLTPPIK